MPIILRCQNSESVLWWERKFLLRLYHRTSVHLGDDEEEHFETPELLVSSAVKCTHSNRHFKWHPWNFTSLKSMRQFDLCIRNTWYIHYLGNSIDHTAICRAFENFSRVQLNCTENVGSKWKMPQASFTDILVAVVPHSFESNQRFKAIYQNGVHCQANSINGCESRARIDWR